MTSGIIIESGHIYHSV